MKVGDKHYRTIWVKEDDYEVIQAIDQRVLPHKFVIEDISNVDQMCVAIKELHVRGAGLIGAAAGYGMYLAALEAPKNEKFDDFLVEAGKRLKATRPTAVNLARAVHKQLAEMKKASSVFEKVDIAFKTANMIADEDAEFCRRLGEHGVKIIEEISKRKNGEVVNILTHCNAGWLAFVDYGTATAPIYEAVKRGIKVHVWVDETRPHNKGIRLTSWELMHEGVPHTNIVDNVGGHLMQHGMVDMVITGTDRVTRTGFVANQIGTYLKALAAKDNNIPFYIALPSTTFDFSIRDGIKEIPIEERSGDDTKYVHGLVDGEIKSVLLAPKDSKAVTFVFDVTPPQFITALITERGICKATEEDILRLYPEHKPTAAETGSVKFQCDWLKSKPADYPGLKELNDWRSKLFALKLIGVYDNGIGYGNISARCNYSEQFMITGSGTGGIETLGAEHYTKVVRFDLETNKLVCEGPIQASSESMTHGTVYQECPEANAIIYIHNLELWEQLVDKIPTTSRAAEFGTPAMAKETQRLFRQTDVKQQKIFVMGGHKEGIVSFGKDLAEAGAVLLECFYRLY